MQYRYSPSFRSRYRRDKGPSDIFSAKVNKAQILDKLSDWDRNVDYQSFG